jgi:DNA-binding transcriptional LysR family regulator
VVAEELHYGRAAARLHMEPQPLNFQIKQLERELGFALIGRREKRTYLTAAGAVFLTHANDILAEADRAVEHGALVARGESGVLRVGYVSPIAHDILAPVIRDFRVAYPEVSFDLRMMGADEQERALNHQEIEVGFALLPAPDENFDALLVDRVGLTLAVPADDPLAGRECVTWHELDGRERISIAHRYSAAQQRIDMMLAHHGIQLPTVQYADEAEAILAFVAVGLGIALVPLYFARSQHPGVVFLELPADAEKTDFGAIWRRDDEHPLRERFIEALAAAANAHAAPAGTASANV